MLTPRDLERQRSIQERLASFAKNSRAAAALLPPGSSKDELRRKARQADMTAGVDGWISSPGLQPPK